MFAAPLQEALLVTGLVGSGLLGISLLLGFTFAGGLSRALGRLAVAGPVSPRAPATCAKESVLASALAQQATERDRAIAQLRLMFDHSPVGMVRSDTGGRVQDANDAFLQIVGKTRADLKAGRIRWDELTPPEWIGHDEAAIAEAVPALARGTRRNLSARMARGCRCSCSSRSRTCKPALPRCSWLTCRAAFSSRTRPGERARADAPRHRGGTDVFLGL